VVAGVVERSVTCFIICSFLVMALAYVVPIETADAAKHR
jgi:hypothetical protein